MLSNLIIDVEDFDVYQNVIKYLRVVNSIVETARIKNLDYRVSGHISLIIQKQKAYRKINDIDIIINKNQMTDWCFALKNDWDIIFDKPCLEKTLDLYNQKKFASTDKDFCGSTEKDADIYFFLNGLTSFNHTKKTLNNKWDFWFMICPWIVHNPNENSPNQTTQFENINDEYFRIWFETPNIDKKYESFVTLNVDNIKTKFSCSPQIEIKENDKILSKWWVSDFIKKPSAKFSYQIYSEKSIVILKFKHKREDIKLDLIVANKYKNFTDQITISKNISGKNVNLSSIDDIFKAKFEREKDFEDYNFFYN